MQYRWSEWQQVPRRHPVWTGVLGGLVLLFVLLVLFNWNWVKGPVERIVSGITHREFHIDGHLDVDLIPLEFTAGKVRLGNASWSEEPVMASAERIDARVRFWPLLVGRVTLPELRVDSAQLRLERNADGAGNWLFTEEPRECPPSGCPSRVRVLQLTAREGRVQFLDPVLQTAIDVRFDSEAPPRPGALAPLVLKGSGTWREGPFELSGKVDSPLALQQADLPYQLDLSARAGDTSARVSGSLAEPLQVEEVTLDAEIRGADLADLYEFTGIVLPATPPYALAGRLSRHGNRFSYEDFSGTVGDSDLSGDAHFDIGGKRPKFTAKLQSRVIDIDDLAGFVGGTPGTGEGEAASPKQKQKAARQRATGRRLPATPIRLERLRSMDADVTLNAARIKPSRLPLESLQARLVLDDGMLSVDPMDFAAAGGKLAGTVKLDARTAPAVFALDIELQRLQLPKLIPRVESMKEALGTLNGALRFTGEGNSAAAVMASADGEFNAIMGRGRMSNLLLEFAGLDIAEAVVLLIGKDKQVPLRCAYADFELQQGVATARAVAFDTTDTVLLLRGDVDFNDESLDFTIVPKPKDPSPISIRTPLRIEGTLLKPAFGVKPEPLLLRAAVVAGLVAIAPPLGLLGLVETGPGEDTGCGVGAPPDRKRETGPPLVPGPRPPPGAPVQPQPSRK